MKEITLSSRAQRFVSSTAVCALALAMTTGSAFAQAAPAETEDEASPIIVTGSRISRPELDVATPIVSISAETIAASGKVNLSDYLTRNPALTASTGSTLAGGADANFGETGGNYLNLRNLGTERTLVLVNGRRHVSGLANTGSVDINTIPQDLIERVDVLTGGASAVYGADGVSGVVNFVLKRKFEGLSARGQIGISGKGDAGTRFGSAVAGTNFSGDRGNITVAYEFNESDRLSSFNRSFTGDPFQTFALQQDPADFAVDNPAVPDRRLFSNLRWTDSSPDGAIDIDFDGIPEFTGSGGIYDRGTPLPASGGRTVGGSSTPLAGYFGDLAPSTRRHSVNLLSSFELTPAITFFAEGKFVDTQSFSVGQPSFDFFTFIQPDNAFLLQRFGTRAPDGALLTRDNLDLGSRGETINRQTLRGVAGFEGDISEDAKFELSYVYGETKTKSKQTSNLIGDRYFAALDAVVDPVSGRIVCRSTITPGDIDPDNYGRPATTFTTGANSTCRPLNLFGTNVASQEALNFVLADNINTSKLTQQVISGSISGDFDAFFKLPGGSIGFALGAEYRRETSLDTPDALIANGEFRDLAQFGTSTGKFDVKEIFAELNAPLLAEVPFAHALSVSAAIRLSDYSTIGKTTTWKFEGIYAPIADIRFRGTYSQAVRAPNIGELFQPSSGTFGFVTDPCDFRRRGEGTSFRAANCTTILSGLGLSAAEIAAFSPSTDAQNTTSRRGTTGGNPLLQEETARTWTAGVALRPSFLRGFSATFDWYNIRIAGAVNTPTATELAELCVDQPTVNNQFCANIFRANGTGFVLGDGNDLTRRIGFAVLPQNVAAFRTAGADFSVNYAFTPKANIGSFNVSLIGGYLNEISFVPSIGADVDDDLREAYNPRWRGTLDLGWKLGGLSVNYTANWFEKTRRFRTETLAGNPDITDPRFFFFKELWEHDIRVGYAVNETFSFYTGVNNVLDAKPDFDQLSYPSSAVGRFVYAGAKVKF